jgi:hypothetical protein
VGLITGVVNENANFGVTLNTVLQRIIWTDRQRSFSQHGVEINDVSLEKMIERKSSSIHTGEMWELADVDNLVAFF